MINPDQINEYNQTGYYLFEDFLTDFTCNWKKKNL